VCEGKEVRDALLRPRGDARGPNNSIAYSVAAGGLCCNRRGGQVGTAEVKGAVRQSGKWRVIVVVSRAVLMDCWVRFRSRGGAPRHDGRRQHAQREPDDGNRTEN
jgi:hypothetical protein